MMTGHRNPKRDGSADSEYPGHGAIASAVFGSNHPTNGMPAYVKQGKIEGEQPSYLGGAHKPFDPSNKENLIPRISVERFAERTGLLTALDQVHRVPSPQARAFTKIGDQAYNVVLGNAKDAFDLGKEPESVRSMYGKGGVGDQMLLARRLAQFGSLRRDAPEEPAQGQPVEDLTAINAKLDRILEEGRSRDTVLLQHLQHLLRMQQQQQGRGASQGRIAEAFE
jgi:hypothetical protein